MSHPSWVCGLKHNNALDRVAPRASHPSWVCGLKLQGFLDKYNYQLVTPFVGVWIETFKMNNYEWS